jgi:hypothetical protein
VHRLCAEKAAFVVIETEAERVDHLRELSHALHGNAADEELKAGEDRSARGLVACGQDENVYIVLTARGLRADLNIVARAAVKNLKRLHAGADRVMLPSKSPGGAWSLCWCARCGRLSA